MFVHMSSASAAAVDSSSDEETWNEFGGVWVCFCCGLSC